jgi:Rps23 Pro-64 3,4-dihydroxylase Tpa1-like proline 4-hydroxylase
MYSDCRSADWLSMGQTLKVQLNGGDGACFPLHFDSDRAVDGRILTAIFYLNPGWVPSDGGQLRLLPFPGSAVDIEPLFDRLVIFSSQDVLHRVLPAASLRMCLTLWFCERLFPPPLISHSKGTPHPLPSVLGPFFAR